jgi:hypothetical protein
VLYSAGKAHPPMRGVSRDGFCSHELSIVKRELAYERGRA